MPPLVQFDYILKLADVLEVSLDRLLRGRYNAAPEDNFDVRNKRLKELCKRVDQLTSQDQEVICHFLDLAVRYEQIKQVTATVG